MSRGRDRVGGTVFLILGGLAVLVALLVIAGGSTAGPYHPDSNAPDGLRALVLLLRSEGAEVDVVPGSTISAEDTGRYDAVFAPVPALAEPAVRSAWRRYASAGGRLVLSGDDGDSGFDGGIMLGDPFEAGLIRNEPAEPTAAGTCDVRDLGDLRSIDTLLAFPVAVPDDARSCFGDGNEAHVVARRLGDGEVVRLSSPVLFTNGRLHPDKHDGGRALDNGPLAVRLMAPRDGVRIAIVEPVAEGGMEMPVGDRSPWSYLDDGVRAGLWQLLVALLLYCWWRARRLGRVIEEPLPVEIESSEFTAAVGELLRRRRRPAHAAAIVRADTARLLRRRLGLAPDAPHTTLVDAVAARSGRPPEDVDAVLATRPVGDDEALRRLLVELDDIRHAVVGMATSTKPGGPV